LLDEELQEAEEKGTELDELYRDRDAERRGKTDKEIKTGVDASEVPQGQCDTPNPQKSRKIDESPTQRSGSGGGIDGVGRAREVDPDASGADPDRLASEDE
jgi:hypothetical protein